MNTSEMILDNAARLLCGVLIISIIWQVLETLLYGEVQPRQVDNIITGLYVAFVIRAYTKGLKDGANL